VLCLQASLFGLYESMYAVIEALGERDLKLSELLAAVAGAVQPGSELHTFWARRHLADCLEQQEAQQQELAAAGASSSSSSSSSSRSTGGEEGRRQQGGKGRRSSASGGGEEGDPEVEALIEAKMSSQAAAMAAATDMLPPVKSKAKQEVAGSSRGGGGRGQGGKGGFGGASTSLAAAVRQADQACLRAHTARYGALSEARWASGLCTLPAVACLQPSVLEMCPWTSKITMQITVEPVPSVATRSFFLASADHVQPEPLCAGTSRC
jgi:hypothetical protein